MTALEALVVAAPAKVNLFLHVTGRRADGYHTLESLFALIDLADVVTLARRSDGAIVRAADVAGIPEAEDLALRAARALQRASGTPCGVTLAVDKRIPLGGGLGGGSSDAASVLLALNRLWHLGLPRDALARIGAGLGADVPFFIGGENALARGVGEALTPVSLPRRWLVLARPPVASADSADLRGAGIDTNDAVSENRRLFRGLWPERSRNRRGGEIPGGGRRDRSAQIGVAPRTDDGLRRVRDRRLRERARGARGVAGIAAGIGGSVVRTLARHPLAAFA